MSTRANILITDAQGNENILYHHHDGYPEGVGRELQRIVRHITDEIEDPESLASFITLQDPTYEPTEGIHGDIDYLYTIDTSKHELYYEAHHTRVQPRYCWMGTSQDSLPLPQDQSIPTRMAPHTNYIHPTSGFHRQHVAAGETYKRE